MKKILSLLSALAIVCTMLTSVAFAEDSKRFFFEENWNEAKTELTLTLCLTTDETLSSFGAYYGVKNLLNAGVTIVSTEKLFDAGTTGTVFGTTNLTPAANATTQIAASAAGATINPGTYKIANIVLNVKNMTAESAAFTQQRALNIKDAAGTKITTFVNDAASYEVKKPADEGFKPAAGGTMVNPADGKTNKTYLTDIVEFNTDETAPSITIKDEAGETKTFDGDWYPTNLKGQGTIKVLVIVRYAGATEKTFSIVNE